MTTNSQKGENPDTEKPKSIRGPLPYIHISEAVRDALSEIQDRRDGKLSGLRTRWPRFNRIIGGGLQWGNNYVIAAVAGAGKSAVAGILETDLFDLNPKISFIVLDFNFEMPSSRQVLRKISARTGSTVNELLSSGGKISDELMEQVKLVSEKVKQYEIYYFDLPGTVRAIFDTIVYFRKLHPDKRLVNIFDHTRLVNPDNDNDERVRIDRLAKMCMVVKKSTGCTNVILSQLNRDIESAARISNPSLQRPFRSDIFGSDSLYQCADVVCFPHRPELLGIEYYMPQRFPTKDTIFWHIDKNRDGPTGFIRMKHDLAHNIVEESVSEEKKEEEQQTLNL